MRLPWRMQTDDSGGFDELVVGKALHVEMMDSNVLWLAVYPEGMDSGERWAFTITMDKDGKVKRCTLSEEPEARAWERSPKGRPL